MELEQLRRINNELEEAHVALETQLFQETEQKEQIIQELIIRYNLQHNLLQETNLREKQLKEESIIALKIKTTPIVVESEHLLQKVRLLELNELKNSIDNQMQELSLSHARDENKILQVIVSTNLRTAL